MQYGWSALGVTLLTVTPAPYTVASMERDSGMSCLLVFTTQSIWLCYGAGQLQTSPGNTFCLRQAAANQRSAFLHVACGGTPCYKMSRGKKYTEAEAWAHLWWIGLFRASSEVQWPGYKWGSPSRTELEANGHNGGGLFCRFLVSFL